MAIANTIRYRDDGSIDLVDEKVSNLGIHS